MRRVFVIAAVAACGGCGASKPLIPSSAPAAAPQGAALELSIKRSEAKGNAAAAPLLSVMSQELERSMTSLADKADPAPYFIGYQVTDRQSVTVTASRGALTNSSESRCRTLDLDVRVGDYELDNTRPLRGARFSFRAYRAGAAELPLEDDERALRAAMWLATDTAYKNALERYIQVKANTSVTGMDRDAQMEMFMAASRGGDPALLVRGAILGPVRLRAWRDVVVGKRYSVHSFGVSSLGGAFAMMAGARGEPASIVAPELLFPEVEVKASSGSKRKPPILPNPLKAR